MTDHDSTAAPARTPEPAASDETAHFKPTGTIFILGMFVVALVLLWASVYIILLSRGVTT